MTSNPVTGPRRLRGAPTFDGAFLDRAGAGRRRRGFFSPTPTPRGPMSIELKPVQVRLSEEAHAALRLLADIEDKDLGEKARELLTRQLLGEVHAAKVHAARIARATAGDNLREAAVERDGRARR